MKRHSVWAVATVVLPLMTGCSRDDVTGVASPSASLTAAPSTPVLRDLIVFSTEEFGPHTQLAVVQPDGSGRRRLTNDTHGYIYPAISPDGRRIVVTRFTSDGKPEGIFLMNADGSGQTLLVNRSPTFDGEPAWSPDGARIAFTSFVDGPFGAFGRIFIINVDGTGLRQLTPDVDPNDFKFDGGASWSPDGTRIVFTRSGMLHVINVDGTGFTALPNEDDAQNPAWSPDGKHIAYEALDSPGDIRMRDPDGSNPVTITNTAEQQGWPRWSPDSRRLVFNRVVGGRFQLFVINVDGTGETRLSFGGSEELPYWSPFPPGRSGAGASIVITPTDAKLAPSETRQFTATVSAGSGNVIDHAAIAWSTSDAGVATVTSSGLVTAVANGRIEIQAAFGSDTARAQVRVADRVLRNVIVFSTDAFGLAELAAVNPDGTGRRRLTTDQFGYGSPAISPDGRRIAFTTNFVVFSIAADAAGISEGFTQLFFGFGGGAGSFPLAPDWSPDGSQIAFSAVVSGSFGPVRRILIVGADGSGLHELTADDPASDDGPTWSPDGTRLVFTRNGVLQVINADGTGLTPLASEGGVADPDWSPDGARIAYGSLTAGVGIRIRNADGSNPVSVTSGLAPESHPRWSPDSRRLVFVRIVNGVSQLFVVNADGTGEVRLSQAAANEAAPSWSPVP